MSWLCRRGRIRDAIHTQLSEFLVRYAEKELAEQYRETARVSR